MGPAAATIQGLVGLVVLGDAWESIDVYYALASALAGEGRNHAAHLALLRARDPSQERSGSGCGCTSAPAAGPWALMLLALFRRQSSARTSAGSIPASASQR